MALDAEREIRNDADTLIFLYIQATQNPTDDAAMQEVTNLLPMTAKLKQYVMEDLGASFHDRQSAYRQAKADLEEHLKIKPKNKYGDEMQYWNQNLETLKDDVGMTLQALREQVQAQTFFSAQNTNTDSGGRGRGRRSRRRKSRRRKSRRRSNKSRVR